MCVHETVLGPPCVSFFGFSHMGITVYIGMSLAMYTQFGMFTIQPFYFLSSNSTTVEEALRSSLVVSVIQVLCVGEIVLATSAPAQVVAVVPVLQFILFPVYLLSIHAQ
jgi:hypothetical protein